MLFPDVNFLKCVVTEVRLSRSFDVQIHAYSLSKTCIKNVIIITLFYTNCTRGLAPKRTLAILKRSKNFFDGGSRPL